jgi:hypothetical protein
MLSIKNATVSAVVAVCTIAANAQSGATRVLSSDGKTYIVTAPLVDGCASGLRFNGASGTIYCPGFTMPLQAPGGSPSPSSTASIGGCEDCGRAPNSTSTQSFEDGSTFSVTTDENGNVVGTSSTPATDVANAGAPAADADADGLGEFGG